MSRFYCLSVQIILIPCTINRKKKCSSVKRACDINKNYLLCKFHEGKQTRAKAKLKTKHISSIMDFREIFDHKLFVWDICWGLKLIEKLLSSILSRIV